MCCYKLWQPSEQHHAALYIAIQTIQPDTVILSLYLISEKQSQQNYMLRNLETGFSFGSHNTVENKYNIEIPTEETDLWPLIRVPVRTATGEKTNTIFRGLWACITAAISFNRYQIFRFLMKFWTGKKQNILVCILSGRLAMSYPFWREIKYTLNLAMLNTIFANSFTLKQKQAFRDCSLIQREE